MRNAKRNYGTYESYMKRTIRRHMHGVGINIWEKKKFAGKQIACDFFNWIERWPPLQRCFLCFKRFLLDNCFVLLYIYFMLPFGFRN